MTSSIPEIEASEQNAGLVRLEFHSTLSMSFHSARRWSNFLLAELFPFCLEDTKPLRCCFFTIHLCFEWEKSDDDSMKATKKISSAHIVNTKPTTLSIIAGRPRRHLFLHTHAAFGLAWAQPADVMYRKMSVWVSFSFNFYFSRCSFDASRRVRLSPLLSQASKQPAETCRCSCGPCHPSSLNTAWGRR